MKKGICICLVLVSLLFSGCGSSYQDKVGWDCDAATFEEYYYSLYRAELTRLKEKYALECTERVEKEEKSKQGYATYYIYFYNDFYTAWFTMHSYGAYSVNLYYYQTSNTDLMNFEEQRNAVAFVNDFTNFVAYDTQTEGNPFELLFKEALQQESLHATLHLHYDSAVGNVGYSVQLSREWNGNWYQMKKDSDLKILSNEFYFRGLLKPPD